MRTNALARISIILLLPLAAASAQSGSSPLAVSSSDLRIEQRDDAGYHLFVRAKPGLGSVLLVETTKDPSGVADNYAYRAEAWNPVNGDERRMLDGAFIDPARGLWSLIDSTPEPDASFGSAYHVFIPWVVAYGYPWSRNGREFIADGTFVNIRAFAKPYADYSGGFVDNPYRISVTQKPFPRPEPRALPAIEPPAPIVDAPKPEPKPVDTSIYMPETLRSFESIAESGKGTVSYSLGAADIVPTLERILDAVEGESLDLVICLDTTESMADDIEAVKTSLPAMVAEKTKRFSAFRLGLVLYKDYFEDYVVKRMEFTQDVGAFTDAVTRVRVAGGRDIPEAVYEALYEALIGYPWSADAMLVVLIGDAPAHPLPRGRISKAMVDAKSAELGVAISVIVLPH
ncbi:MAG TPA: VWA domain-containing protein [Spirochaetia bacterium]|nr:VWA domain-containing protein [Spirochaetales bacterium]HRW23533.1 VWA domain-containing protein [Spirochaetia bacterium]